ncbi:MAG: C4-dicarboxylate ABC transporter substrate-binding protein, partial [Hoeflea sp.]|nr:C4-dicarboxylate ABC transporter substrate-binding protein [Hoeflea sp.]
MTYSKILSGALFAAAMTLAGVANAQIKIALDSPPDLEGSGSYVWAHTFSTYLNEHGMPAEEFA